MKRWPLWIALVWTILVAVIALIAGADVIGSIGAGICIGFVVYVPLALIAWFFARNKARSSTAREAPQTVEGPGRFAVAVVGESHYQDALQEICGPEGPGGRTFEASLILDDSNPYDPNAVRVDVEGRTVGYLSREAAPIFRKRVAKRRRVTLCQAEIRGSTIYGVWLDLPT